MHDCAGPGTDKKILGGWQVEAECLLEATHMHLPPSVSEIERRFAVYIFLTGQQQQKRPE